MILPVISAILLLSMWTGISLSWQRVFKSRVFKTVSLTFLSPWGDHWAPLVCPQCWAWLLQHAASGSLDFLHGGLGSQRVFQETGNGGCLPGSSPSGSRVIRRWGQSQRPGKNLFNYRYRGRLEIDSVVGELMEKRG